MLFIRYTCLDVNKKNSLRSVFTNKILFCRLGPGMKTVQFGENPMVRLFSRLHFVIMVADGKCNCGVISNSHVFTGTVVARACVYANCMNFQHGISQ